VQLAGNVGFLSPGVGWAWGRQRVEADLFFGWVPRAIGGDDIVSFTGKLTWLPWHLSVGRRWLVRPLTASLQVTYTLGGDYWLTLPARYRPDYYDVPTAVRAGLGFGAAVGRRGGGKLRELGAYAELVALDTMLFTWARNTEALGPADVFSLAVGVRASF
jgi:hypothetical protein